MDDDLVAWGRVLRVVTHGRRSGRPAQATVGFIEEPDGTLLVAAGDRGAAWARNLLADPHCQVTVADRTTLRIAVPLDGADRTRAIVALIIKYGTPAERLGAGPAFALREVPADR